MPSGLQRKYKKVDVGEMNPPKFDRTEDMSNLSLLNEGSGMPPFLATSMCRLMLMLAVLDNLRKRYQSMLIYVSH